MADPQISDDEIIAGVRALRGNGAQVRLRKRARLRPTAGLTGSYFERVRLEIDGRPLKAILKWGGLKGGPPTRERLFFAELAHDVPMRVPEAYGAGPARDGADGWVLMEALPRGRRISEWPAEETPRALRNLAALHARYLGCAPASLPRPFTRDLDEHLDFVPAGIAALRAKYEELPGFPRGASDEALSLLAALVERRDVLREAFARSPETLLHGDYHRGNLVVRDREPHAVFDWQFVCAGPPAYDIAVFWVYMGAVNVPGFLRFFDRMRLVEREMTWEQTLDVYCDELRVLRPDADVEGIREAADAAVAWEVVRQVTYFAAGMANFEGLLRFIYRDHRTVGGWFARWMGISSAWDLYGLLFQEFEARAARLLAGGGVSTGASHS